MFFDGCAFLKRRIIFISHSNTINERGQYTTRPPRYNDRHIIIIVAANRKNYKNRQILKRPIKYFARGKEEKLLLKSEFVVRTTRTVCRPIPSDGNAYFGLASTTTCGGQNNNDQKQRSKP